MKLTAFLLGLGVFLALLAFCISDTVHEKKLKHPGSVSEADHHKASAKHSAAHKKAKKHEEFDHSKKSGSHSVEDEEKASKGETLKELHKVDDEEGGGKKSVSSDEKSHKSSHKSGGKSEDGSKFQEGAYHKKQNSKKGFREKYHKDEQKKHDSFYSNSVKSGEFKIFGKKSSKQQSQSLSSHGGTNHKGNQLGSAHGIINHKKGGHNVDVKKGHKSQKAHKQQRSSKEKHGKVKGSKGGKHFKYSTTK